MSYEKIRNKKIPKHLFGNSLSVLDGTFEERMRKKLLRQQQIQALGIDPEDVSIFSDDDLNNATLSMFGAGEDNAPIVNLTEGIDFGSSEADKNNAALLKANKKLRKGVLGSEFDDIEDEQGTLDAQYEAIKYQQQNKADTMKKASIAMGIAGEAAVAAVNQVDNATMGDKNFSASSLAIDQVVHGTSGMLMKSGNPYAIAAGVALEGINFITKAGGKNVQGYDVNINNSGYGTMGHQESEAGRIWEGRKNVARRLAKRNEQARMALAAADISEDQVYEQEARANSVDNILRQNSIALAGGIDTSLLAN